ncbi:MAG: hydrogenase nickel incorporation protein HypB [Gammaproteobacteria bacterium]
MCSVCGCGEDTGGSADHPHRHFHEHGHSHHHHDHHYGHGDAGVSVAGFSQDRLIEIEQNILSKNDQYADSNRRQFTDQGLLALNLVSSPGAGKTTLLVETIGMLKGSTSIGVIEGDQETANDAQRIQACGVPAVQINTGRGCHLDAHMVGHALDDLAMPQSGVVFIENVGNLVCPAAFDLGETFKVVILSVTEGEDKPLKYPDMFAAADLMILSKVDLLPHVNFDPDQAIERARRINPALGEIRLSACNGEGMSVWRDWIVQRTVAARDKRAQATA